MVRIVILLLFFSAGCSTPHFERQTLVPSSGPTSSKTASEILRTGQLRVFASPSEDRVIRLQQYEATIRELGVHRFNFHNVGSVVEALGLRGLEREWDTATYEILPGIVYTDAKTGRTIGELDLSVMHKETGDFMMVSEVKTSNNMRGAATKANKQLKRFRDTIASDQDIRIQSTAISPIQFTRSQFSNVTQFQKIGSHGALNAGFHWEVDISRAEVDQLHARLKPRKAVPVGAGNSP